MSGGWLRRSVTSRGFFDKHPILVPATIFSICWIPYMIVFFRKTISFGDLGGAYPFPSMLYWMLFAVQLIVCVVSHSLTIRTIVRLYAPNWLIWGSILFFSLSPAWGIMVAADIRHPLFAAVFCVFVSSATFALYGAKTSTWLWVQLAGGALCVCLLRENGLWAVLPTLLAILIYKVIVWRKAQAVREVWHMQANPHKKKEAVWSDVCAAFLVLSGVGLLVGLSHCFGWGLPLGEPSYGAASGMESSMNLDAFGWNLTGTNDVAGIIPFTVVADNSLFPQLAIPVAQFFYLQQNLPAIDLTFSWMFFLVFFGAFVAFAISILAGRKHAHDARPIILALPMIMVLVFMTFVPADVSLRYMMPVLAAQPMMIGAGFASMRNG